MKSLADIHAFHSFAALWNLNSKSAGKKERSWLKTTPREDEKKKRRSINSLPSTSAKRTCVEKTKKMKGEADNAIWYPLHRFGIRTGQIPGKPPRGPQTWGRKNAPGPKQPQENMKRRSAGASTRYLVLQRK